MFLSPKKERKKTAWMKERKKTHKPKRGMGDEDRVKKERKKTHNPREGWENGTPPPHRDFKERRV